MIRGLIFAVVAVFASIAPSSAFVGFRSHAIQRASTRSLPVRPIVVKLSATTADESTEEVGIVQASEETIKTSIAVTGAATGLVFGGPVLAAIGAILANYAASKDGDAKDAANVIGKLMLNLYNLLLKTNASLQVTDKITAQIEEAVEKAKAGEQGESATKFVEVLDTIVSKAGELNSEFGIVSALKDVLVKAGNLSVEAIDSGIKYADENNLGDKIKNALVSAVEKAKEKAQEAKEKSNEASEL